MSQTLVELTFPIAAHYATVVPIAKSSRAARAQAPARRRSSDPVVRDKLTPRYGLGCKRPGFSNDYLRDVQPRRTSRSRPRRSPRSRGDAVVHRRRRPRTVRRADPRHRLQGLRARQHAAVSRSAARGGLDLEAFWAENRFQAYQGVSVPGFPNMFTILGPYGYNGASYFTLIENQSRHIVRCLRQRARELGATRVEVTARGQRPLLRRDAPPPPPPGLLPGRAARTANSYYFDDHGDVPFRAVDDARGVVAQRAVRPGRLLVRVGGAEPVAA